MSERIASTVKYLGLESDGIVVAGGVLEAAGIRQTSDVDLCVSDERFRQLRESGQWTEGRCADGRPILRVQAGEHMAVEVAAGWGEGYSHKQLKEGDFVKDGVHYAGLDTVYAWKQDNTRPKDAPDIDLIKGRLLERPMPEEMSAREMEFLKSLAPENLHDHPALRVAANGLLLVTTLYGRDYNGPVRRYTGDVERDIPAFGHTRFHTAGGLVRLRDQIDASDARRKRLGLPSLYSESDKAALFALYAYHDAIIGARGTEERKSAELVRLHLIIAGSDFDDIPDKAKTGVEDTIFDDKAGKQTGGGRKYRVVGDTTKGIDLGNLPSPLSPLESVWMGVEDLCKVRAGYDRLLARRAEELGVTIHDLEVALAVADSSPETRAAYGDKMGRAAGLHQNHTYSGLWELDNPQTRHEHAACLRGVSQRVSSGELSPSDSLDVIKSHVAAQYERQNARSGGRVINPPVVVDLKLGHRHSAPAIGPRLGKAAFSKSTPETNAASLLDIASGLAEIQERIIGGVANDTLGCISSLEASIAAIQEAAGSYSVGQPAVECLGLLSEAAAKLRTIVSILGDDDGLKGILEAYISNLGFE